MNTPEMSRLVDTQKIPLNGLEIDIKASEKECKAIAERLGLVSLDDFTGLVFLNKQENSILVKGSFHADVVQESIVSLKPVSAHIEDGFEESFVEETPADADPDDFSAPEVIENNTLDIGEIMVEYLALALDEFPRDEKEPDFVYEDEPKKNPFAILEKLKK